MSRVVSSLLFLVLFSFPALAWEIVPSRICELRHEEDNVRVRVTYDHALSEYSISITLNRAWPKASQFSIRFDGQRSLKISTRRHVISDAGVTLTVKDRGFDNVLDGIELNDTATAQSGDQSVVVSLKGAAPAVRAFRAYTEGVGV